MRHPLAAAPIRRRSLALLLLAAGLAGCSSPDPGGALQSYVARKSELPPVSGGGCGGTLDCASPASVEVSGSFFLAFSTVVQPGAPLLFRAEVERTSGELSVTMRALASDTTPDGEPRDDAREVVGEPIEPAAVETNPDGSFLLDMGTVEIPQPANPILEAPVEAEFTMEGRFCDEDGFCGSMDGQVTVPTEIDLEGSRFGAIRTDDVVEAPLRCGCSGSGSPGGDVAEPSEPDVADVGSGPDVSTPDADAAEDVGPTDAEPDGASRDASNDAATAPETSEVSDGAPDA